MLLTVAGRGRTRASQRDRSELRRALLGLALAGAACDRVLFAVLNPYALLNPAEARDQITGQSSQADTAKLGQDDTVRLAVLHRHARPGASAGCRSLAAVAGAVLAIRRDWRLALLLVAFPVCFYLYMGAQGRFFGRWLLPIYPALCVLAGYARGADSARAARAVLAGLTAPARAPRARSRACTSTRVLGREDTRAQALRVGRRQRAGGRAGRRRAVRARRRTATALDRPVWPVERPFQAYEKRLRVRHIDRYRERGYCWVIVGSTQKERGLKAGLTSSRNYYRALDAASERDGHVLAVRARRRPGRVLLRQLVQLPAARVRAPRPRRRDPPAARLHSGDRVTGPRMSVTDPSAPRRRRPHPRRRRSAPPALGPPAHVRARRRSARSSSSRCSWSGRRIPTTTPTTRSYGARSWATGSCPTTTCSARPTPHPLSTAVAWAMAPFGTASDRILVLASLFGLLAFYVVAFVFTERLLGRVRSRCSPSPCCSRAPTCSCSRCARCSTCRST